MRLTTLCSALFAAMIPMAAHAQFSGDVVKIGVLTDMAGVTADITGKGSLLAAEMAVRELGGTVLGKPVQVISADHQHKADVGTGIARQWIDVEGVDVGLRFRAPAAGRCDQSHCGGRRQRARRGAPSAEHR